LPAALLDSRRSQTFSVAALLDELTLQPCNLAVKQVVGLVDQADNGVGHHGWVGVVEPRTVTPLIGPIGRIRLISPILFSHRSHFERSGIVFCPLVQTALPQKVFEIKQQFV
jgi:hypothetical protein